MGKMLLEKLAAKTGAENMLVANRTHEKIDSLADRFGVCGSNAELAALSDIIFVCVRPADIKTVLTEIAPAVRENALLVSLNGSLSFDTLGRLLRHKTAKVIPSVTAEIDRSQTLVCYNDMVGEDDKHTLKELLGCMGSVIELPENELGMGSELVSCMPGFIASVFDVMCRAAGEHTSISDEQIVNMVLNTLTATGELMLRKNMSFSDVVDRVATKGGITEEGTKVVYEKFPAIARELFKKTLEKRRQTALKAEEIFG
jgi:pyrroline-5-carboxylate reductase